MSDRERNPEMIFSPRNTVPLPSSTPKDGWDLWSPFATLPGWPREQRPTRLELVLFAEGRGPSPRWALTAGRSGTPKVLLLTRLGPMVWKLEDRGWPTGMGPKSLISHLSCLCPFCAPEGQASVYTSEEITRSENSLCFLSLSAGV